jgi:hypothetical protein
MLWGAYDEYKSKLDKLVDHVEQHLRTHGAFLHVCGDMRLEWQSTGDLWLIFPKEHWRWPVEFSASQLQRLRDAYEEHRRARSFAARRHWCESVVDMAFYVLEGRDAAVAEVFESIKNL